MKELYDLGRLKVIGTSHVSEESVKKVREEIHTGDFDIVCVELDKDRLYALSNNIKQVEGIRSIGLIRHVGITGFIFALVASIAQKRIGKKLDTEAGSDMMSAVRGAAEMGIPVALIDQDVRKTLKKLSKEVKFREKVRITADLFKSLIGMKTALNDIDEGFDLKKTPPDEMVEKILKKTKDRYHGLYKVLVDDRNMVMANRILGILKKEPDKNILVVIGAGHKEGLIEKLEKRSGSKYSGFKHKRKSAKRTKEGPGRSIYSESYVSEEH